MEEKYWKIGFFILILIWNLIRAFGIKKEIKKQNKSSETCLFDKFLVSLNVFGMIIVPLIVVFSSYLDFTRMGLDEFTRWFAFIIYALNLWFFWWAHKILGENWSNFLEIKKGHKLIKEGPYKLIRHPMYTHFWVLVITQGLILDNWAVLIFGIVVWAAAYFVRVPKEEKMMIKEFGNKYKEYMKKTGKVLPRLFK